MGNTATDMIAAYISRLKTEQGAFRDKLAGASPSPEDCKEALQALERLSHSWQDYYAHAIVLKNGKAEKQLWTGHPRITGSPTEPKGLTGLIVPSSWDGIARPGEHGWSEVGGNEGAHRQGEAYLYVAGRYALLIPGWAAKCACNCGSLGNPR